jgi:hypothetical protein
MVGMVRALIADPHAIAKSFAGQVGSVTPCIGGNECHYGRAVACATNPAAGREAEMEIVPAAAPKRILIVGAGPAGLECAAAAAERGHPVVLADRRSETGRLLIPLAPASQQADSGKYLIHMRRRIAAAGVELRLGVEADAAWFGTSNRTCRGAGHRRGLSAARSTERGRCQPASGSPKIHRRIGRAASPSPAGLDDHLPPLVLADFIARTGRTVTLLTENSLAGTGGRGEQAW